MEQLANESHTITAHQRREVISIKEYLPFSIKLEICLQIISTPYNAWNQVETEFVISILLEFSFFRKIFG